MAEENAGKAAFDPKHARGQEYREGSAPAVRPKDAATLIIVRRDASAPQVLMGQRHADHKFMPNKFVFPGGRVDPGDGRVRLHDDLDPLVQERLLTRMRGKPSPMRAKALAMAAIRETFEETGLRLGAPTSVPTTRNEAWADYFADGVAPRLSTLGFIARAITPPYRTRRYDTRFFIADAEEIAGDPHAVEGSGELLDLHWLSVEDARGLDLPNITRLVLDELDERLRLTKAAAKERAVPFVHFRNNKPIRDILS